jgi:TPR repeat protein
MTPKASANVTSPPFSWGLCVKPFQILALILYSQFVCCATEVVAADNAGRSVVHDIPFESDFRATRSAAQAGGVDAMLQLGTMYKDAVGVEKNVDAARAWYQRAADAGDARAALLIGRMLQAEAEQEDLQGDHHESPEQWLHRAADGGNVEAYIAMARFLANFPYSGVRRKEADEWIERAARGGHPVAMYQHGAQLSSSADPSEKARGLEFQKRAAAKDPRLEYWLELSQSFKQDARGRPQQVFSDSLQLSAMSIDLEHSSEGGMGAYAVVAQLSALTRSRSSFGEREMAAARDNLKEAAERGNLQAWCNLGILQIWSENYQSAFDSYLRVAEQGSAKAAYHVGVLLREGLGAPPAPTRAAEWFHKAAIQMYYPAQAALGKLLLEGTGVARDVRAALAWLRPAAAYGNPLARFELGLMYDEGLGVEADRMRAVSMIAQAAVDFHMQHGGYHGLPAAKEWLQSAESDPRRANAVQWAVARTNMNRMMMMGKSIDSAPVDCLGREHAF